MDAPVPVREMLQPVRCTCGGVYDLCGVEVVSRHTDCTVWITPCCNRKVDDNIWHSRHQFTRITRDEIDRPRMLPDGTMILTDEYGRMVFYG